jgi:hypothetical protein
MLDDYRIKGYFCIKCVVKFKNTFQNEKKVSVLSCRSAANLMYTPPHR